MRLQSVVRSAALAVILWDTAAAQAPVKVVVENEVLQKHFLGPGFHGELFLDSITPSYFDQVMAKRWRELNPGFARVFHTVSRNREGVQDVAALDTLARELLFMKDATGSEVYVTTTHIRPALPGAERQDYARAVVDDLEYLVKKGTTNLKFYGPANELTMNDWADLRNDLPTYRDYQQLIYAELHRRNLPIALLATDASPITYWTTIEWAAQNMDDIVGIYGGHHYANGVLPDFRDFYGWFKDKCSWAVGIARSKGKDFILGEFGPAQYLELRWGIRWDAALYFETPQEAQAGVQIAEAALAAVNAGVYAMGYWTFADYPDRPGDGINHWGLFKSMQQGGVTRAPYYAYGLLTKFLRGPARVYKVTNPDANLRVAAVQRESDKSWTVAVINREAHAVPVSIMLPSENGKSFRKYVYDPAHVPVTDDGDLQEPSGKLALRSRQLSDTVAANSLAVYTTAYDDEPPAAVQGLEVKPVGKSEVAGMPSDAKRLTWQPNQEKDFCYYRIYHDGVRIASSVSPEFIDAGPTRRRGIYRVVAVDTSGNASR